MKFQLDLSFSCPEKISYRTPHFLIGSCFAENIGEKFRSHFFSSRVNPFGIIFNPHSIAGALNSIINKKTFSEQHLVVQNEIYHCLHHHSSFSNADKTSSLEKINTELSLAHEALKKSSWLIVTFGSAFAWRFKKTGEIVANCHKIPGTEFEKVFLPANEIVSGWKNCLDLLQKFNPGLKVLFTVSPVRYIRDGLTENNRSKASLLTAVHKLTDSKKSFYFPAYELVNDVLRDYRFFKEDMVHPTQQAIDFVWEKFCEGMFDDESLKILEDVKAYRQLSEHRPLFGGELAKEHNEKVKNRAQALLQKHPFLSLSA
jgi:hypothetical protein